MSLRRRPGLEKGLESVLFWREKQLPIVSPSTRVDGALRWYGESDEETKGEGVRVCGDQRRADQGAMSFKDCTLSEIDFRAAEAVDRSYKVQLGADDFVNLLQSQNGAAFLYWAGAV